MQCQRCNKTTEEVFESAGQSLCEDCYMEVLSPTKACDPWAVHSATSSLKTQGMILSPAMERILELLSLHNGAMEENELRKSAGMESAEFMRTIASLRHMELIRKRKDGSAISVVLWKKPQE